LLRGTGAQESGTLENAEEANAEEAEEALVETEA
jgi:hypothetical protein